MKTTSSVTLHNSMTEDIDPFSLGDEFNLSGYNPQQSSTDNSGKIPVKKYSESVPRESVRPFDDYTANEYIIQNSEVSEQFSETSGYRVQIGVYSVQENADILAERARSKIDLNVYVDFETPFYRVRVGDFTTKKEAVRYIKILKAKGFRDSWWIRTKINTK